jgi:List-Bact-rpt repeat protein
MRSIAGSTQGKGTSMERPLSSHPWLSILCLVAIAIFLAPAARAAAAEFPLKTVVEGSGTIECEVEGEPAEPCASKYPEGTEIAFLADPATGYEFAEWGGDCAGQTECEVTMDEEKFVVATFAPEEIPLELETEGLGLGTIECEVGGGSAEECESSYPYGTEIAFLAEPDSGYEFVEWGGDCSGSGACEVTMTSEKFVLAVFEPIHYLLEIETEEGNGSGAVECEVEGGPLEECEPSYLEGTEIVLVETPATGSEFAGWSGCDANPSETECEVTMDVDKSIGAEFVLEEFSLGTFTAGNGEGAIECEVEGGEVEACEASYPFGTEVALIPIAETGSKFVEWEEDCSGSGACELTIDEEKSVTAIFEPSVSLEVIKNGSGSGTVTSSPAGIKCGTVCTAEYLEGEVVTLTASPSVGSVFAGWTGCEAPSGNECKVTMGEEGITVTATFDLAPPSEFALTVTPAGTGKGTVTSSPAGINCGIDCSEAYAGGTEVTLTATPAAGSTFAGWSGACSGTGACKLTMSQARNVTATFNAVSPAPGKVQVGRTAKVKGGKAQLKLTCKGEGPCKGKLKLTAKIKSGGKLKSLTIGKASFSLAAGARKTLKVKLSAPAKQALAKGPLKAKAGGSGVIASTVKLKPAK